MAVKVMAMVELIDYYDDAQQECGFRVRMYDATHDTIEALGPFSVALGQSAMVAAIKASVRTWAETNWGTDFGALGTVMLVHQNV